jgi:hypothetical protein
MSTGSAAGQSGRGPLAENSFMIDEFLAKLEKDGELDIVWKEQAAARAVPRSLPPEGVDRYEAVNGSA